MASPAMLVRQYLIAATVLQDVSGTTWPSFYGTEPASPDQCVTLYDTGGLAANPDGPYSDPLIQVRVRSHSYADGYAKAEAVRDALILPTGHVIDGEIFKFWLTSDVAKIGSDDNNRELFTINFRAMRN